MNSIILIAFLLCLTTIISIEARRGSKGHHAKGDTVEHSSFENKKGWKGSKGKGMDDDKMDMKNKSDRGRDSERCRCYGSRKPVCGTDGIIYRNRCTMRCLSSLKNVRKQALSRCDSESHESYESDDTSDSRERKGGIDVAGLKIKG